MSPMVKCDASGLNSGSTKPRMYLLAYIKSLILYDACQDRQVNWISYSFTDIYRVCLNPSNYIDRASLILIGKN